MAEHPAGFRVEGLPEDREQAAHPPGVPEEQEEEAYKLRKIQRKGERRI